MSARALRRLMKKWFTKIINDNNKKLFKYKKKLIKKRIQIGGLNGMMTNRSCLKNPNVFQFGSFFYFLFFFVFFFLLFLLFSCSSMGMTRTGSRS